MRRLAAWRARLGRSDIEVSRVGLGCNNFGGRIDRAATERVIDAALEVGVTFFDTADVYGSGDSERFIGTALAGRRDRVVLASKFGQDASIPGREAPTTTCGAPSTCRSRGSAPT